MKKIMIFVLVLSFVSGCHSNDVTFTIVDAPVYKADTASDMTIKAEGVKKTASGLKMTGSLEMEKMDHGTIEVEFTDNGDGTYTGETVLPMAGEWTIDLHADDGKNSYEKVLTFHVNEG